MFIIINTFEIPRVSVPSQTGIKPMSTDSFHSRKAVPISVSPRTLSIPWRRDSMLRKVFRKIFNDWFSLGRTWVIQRESLNTEFRNYRLCFLWLFWSAVAAWSFNEGLGRSSVYRPIYINKYVFYIMRKILLNFSPQFLLI
jgi:hypothetical protein